MTHVPKFSKKGLGRTLLIAGALSWCALAASPAAERWWAHVKFLADDSLEGRNAGSPGHRKAAEYVADQFKQAGLKPMFAGSYLQPVPLRTRRVVREGCLANILREAGVSELLNLGDDYVLSARVNLAPQVEAPLAFIGYGLHTPEANHDDLAGIDVKGKIVVYLSGAPDQLSGSLQSHAGSPGVRWAAFKEAGAVGFISIANPKNMDVPWERSAPSAFTAAMVLADAALDESQLVRFGAAMNPARAEKLFAGSQYKFADLLKIADEKKTLPRFPLPIRIRATIKTELGAVTSENVAGIITGTDPVLSKEYVVLSGHLDHLGIGPAVNGDTIYNGAMDNASGTASMIEAARALAAKPPKRSVIITAVTAEEKGLLGSRYLMEHTGLPASSIVADVNSDMYLPLYPMKILTGIGISESTLKEPLARVAAKFKITLEDDPEPERNLFVRSDHYNFVRKGIPAVFLKIGNKKGSPEEQMQKTWTHDRYHAPSDDLSQPMDLEAAAKFTEIEAAIVREIADQPARPEWNSKSFFRRFAQ